MSAASRRMQAAQAANADTAARAAVAAPRIGIVDGYDPSTYSIKVRIQPEDTLTGWLPLKALVAGNGWGILAPPVQGAQVEVTFEGGDVQLGRVQGCYYSDEDRPPAEAQAGEIIAVHQTGSTLRFTNDGKVLFTSQADMTITCGGTITSSAAAWNHTGPLRTTGQITSDTEVTAKGVNLTTHQHTLVQSGTAKSGPPG